MIDKNSCRRAEEHLLTFFAVSLSFHAMSMRSMPPKREASKYFLQYILLTIASIILAVCIAGCEGCDTHSNRQGVRPKTSMAGQPEEYLDASRLDPKEDSSTVARADSAHAPEENQLDTFEIVSDSAFAEKLEVLDDSLADSSSQAEATSSKPEDKPGPN